MELSLLAPPPDAATRGGVLRSDDPAATPDLLDTDASNSGGGGGISGGSGGSGGGGTSILINLPNQSVENSPVIDRKHNSLSPTRIDARSVSGASGEYYTRAILPAADDLLSPPTPFGVIDYSDRSDPYTPVTPATPVTPPSIPLLHPPPSGPAPADPIPTMLATRPLEFPPDERRSNETRTELLLLAGVLIFSAVLFAINFGIPIVVRREEPMGCSTLEIWTYFQCLYYLIMFGVMAIVGVFRACIAGCCADNQRATTAYSRVRALFLCALSGVTALNFIYAIQTIVWLGGIDGRCNGWSPYFQIVIFNICVLFGLFVFPFGAGAYLCCVRRITESAGSELQRVPVASNPKVFTAALRSEIESGVRSGSTHLPPELISIICSYLKFVELPYRYQPFKGGVFEYLGTRCHTAPYVNPCTVGLVKVIPSSRLLYGSPAVFLGRPFDVNRRRNGMDNIPHSYFVVDLGPNRQLLPTHYFLMNDSQDGYSFYSWCLQAANHPPPPPPIPPPPGDVVLVSTPPPLHFDWVTLIEHAEHVLGSEPLNAENGGPPETDDAAAVPAAAQSRTRGSEVWRRFSGFALPADRIGRELSQSSGESGFRYFRVIQRVNNRKNPLQMHVLNCAGFELYGLLYDTK